MPRFSSFSALRPGMGTVIEEEEDADVPILDISESPESLLYLDDPQPSTSLAPSNSYSFPALPQSEDQSVLASTAIVAPSNEVAPSPSTPPAPGTPSHATSGPSGPSDVSFALPQSSIEYLLPSETHASSNRRNCNRHRSRSRPRARSFPSFRFPCPRRLRRFWRLKRKERNIVAAVSSILVITSLAAALALPRWFYLNGGSCRLHHLGTLEFFGLSVNDIIDGGDDGMELHIDARSATEVQRSSYEGRFGVAMPLTSPAASENIVWSDCVTIQILTLMRTVISLVFVAILCSLLAFCLDALGTQHRPLKFIRRNALGNILTVLLCVIINGFAYWVSTLIRSQQSANKTMAGKMYK